MILSYVGHPSTQTLAAFNDSAEPLESAREHVRVKAHLARCAACRNTVQQLRLARTSLGEHELPEPSASLRERVLDSRVDGKRVILPVNDVETTRVRTPWKTAAIAASVVVVAALAEGVFRALPVAEAGATSGTLTISPAMPRAGEALTLRYEAPASLAGFSALNVRARLRSTNGDAYQGGVPVLHIATLQRNRDGVFEGSTLLPDSIVYAALAVEDSTGAFIDDHDKRTWEVLRTMDGEHPMFAALYQRANDMMGRSFEEGQKSAKQMTELYPDSLGGWSYLLSFESWAGVGDVDSTLQKHRATLSRMDKKWRVSTSVPPELLGRLSWYSRSVDTTVHQYWRARAVREAPTNGLSLQWRLYDASIKLNRDSDTTAVLKAFETIWPDRSVDRAGQIAGMGLSISVASRRREAVGVWYARLQSVATDTLTTSISFGEQLSRTKEFEQEGIARLRNALQSLDRYDLSKRYLTETPALQAKRIARQRRRVLASLGRALVASGATRQGLDTLKRSAADGWDLSVLRTIRTASFAANDSATGWAMTARIMADPSIEDSQRDDFAKLAERTLDEARWRQLQQIGAREFSRRILEDSKMQSLSGTPRLRGMDGQVHTLGDLGRNRVTVVAFWSRFCGWALDDLESLQRVATQLEKAGSQLLIVIDDEAGPSADLTKFLVENKVSTTVYFDEQHSMSKAFNNWGTPNYYVLDRDSRMRFSVVNDAATARVRAEALRLSEVAGN